MDATIRAKVVDIGDKKGICVAPEVLEQLGVKDEVELHWNGENQLVIGAKRHPREGWEEQFKLMAQRGDDQLLDSEEVHHLTEWEEENWEWK